MVIRRAPDIRPSDITPPRDYVRRREFLRAMALPAAAGALGVSPLWTGPPAHAAARGRSLPVVSRLRTTDEALTPYEDATTYNNFYEFGTGKDEPAKNSGDFVAEPWSVEIAGHCARPGTYGLEDVLKPHALVERVYRMRCVEGWSMVIPWVGVPLGQVLRRFEPTGPARFVAFTTVHRPEEMPGQRQRFPRILPWPYVEGLRMDEALHPLALLAVGLYGETLLNQNGAPLRLVVPWKYGFKGIKSIVRIEFTDTQPRTTWEDEWPQAYGFYANVNPAVPHPYHSQADERRIGDLRRRPTEIFNGYGEQVASLYTGMNLRAQY